MRPGPRPRNSLKKNHEAEAIRSSTNLNCTNTNKNLYSAVIHKKTSQRRCTIRITLFFNFKSKKTNLITNGTKNCIK